MIDLPQIYYNQSSIWIPIPRWSQFFLEAGAIIASYSTKPYRIIFGCAIPTKAYAAAFTAAGVISNLAITRNFTEDDMDSKIKLIQDLHPNTPLIYRRKSNTLQKGLFDGYCINKDTICIRIKTRDLGKDTIILPQELLLGVEPIEDPTFTLPKKRISRQIVNEKDLIFLSSYFGNTVAHEIIAYSRLDCLIIGPKELFRRESRDIYFAIKDINSNFVEGNLNLITRTRDLLTDSSAYRSDIVALDSYEEQQYINNPPSVVIFSNAMGFLRHREEWRSSHWIVLLDRTESHFQEAVTELNQEYVRRRVEEDLLNPLPTPPTGVETILYREEW